MFRIFFQFVIIFLLGLNSHAQSKYTTLNEASEKLAKSISDYDIDTYASLIYPEIVEMSGGLESYKSMTKNYKDALAAAGMLIKSAVVDSISEVVNMGDELQCMVTLTLVNKMGENYFQGPAFALAISADEGLHWTFVDLETFDEKGLKDFVPGYDAAKLKFPVSNGMLLIEDK